MATFVPSYLNLYSDGVLEDRITQLYNLCSPCQLCPRACGANRLRGETGYCGATDKVKIAAVHPHFGEEAVMVGDHGSGAVFFCHCNLRCEYCQNFEISCGDIGICTAVDHLADIFMQISSWGCHNLNLVTPTHYLPQILTALQISIGLGFKLPLVYNTGGYESLKVLELMDGIVDIYMPDVKYFSGSSCERYLHARDYPEVVKGALRIMYRQVGNLILEGDIAQHGLLVRHLVMPNGVTDSMRIMDFLYDEISAWIHVNIMSQYRPRHRASQHSALRRRVYRTEVDRVLHYAMELGLDHACTM